jgi:hypothetical protein
MFQVALSPKWRPTQRSIDTLPTLKKTNTSVLGVYRYSVKSFFLFPLCPVVFNKGSYFLEYRSLNTQYKKTTSDLFTRIADCSNRINPWVGEGVPLRIEN